MSVGSSRTLHEYIILRLKELNCEMLSWRWKLFSPGLNMRIVDVRIASTVWHCSSVTGVILTPLILCFEIEIRWQFHNLPFIPPGIARWNVVPFLLYTFLLQCKMLLDIPVRYSIWVAVILYMCLSQSVKYIIFSKSNLYFLIPHISVTPRVSTNTPVWASESVTYIKSRFPVSKLHRKLFIILLS